MSETFSHATVIEALEASAQQLKLLLDKGIAKRPLVIEFSGAPKAGKTRSISVFELFLKRNGIRVEVFTERASVSPIRAKGHLHFNTWVSCASLQGLLEALHRDIDVFVLDRGIFDALVWNDWLLRTGKISGAEAQAFESFFTMPRWTEFIDLVFVMTCDPEKSIEREYADQLTNRRGTIMSEEALRQIRDCIQTTVEKHGSRFKRVERIDTTTTTTREGTARIAQSALTSLNQFLDEQICVIPINPRAFRITASSLIGPSLISLCKR
jgi:hypothetical protein